MSKKTSQKQQLTNEALLDHLKQMSESLQKDLEVIEKDIYEKETNYLMKTFQFGGVTKGFEPGANTSKNIVTAAGGRKVQRFTQAERLFSYSSTTAPLNEEDSKVFDPSAQKRKLGQIQGKSGKQIEKPNRLKSLGGANRKARHGKKTLITNKNNLNNSLGDDDDLANRNDFDFEPKMDSIEDDDDEGSEESKKMEDDSDF